ncbi:hypothetical protein CBE89_13075 [Corynebacterium striatum]|uniref:Uncharacterized protein n=1 Tax=Corynebacterium striatum TaxID=43770 RepID=A0A2Z2JAL6_CORST|nr:hypothetical protein [Corynebacterium striatum]ART22308.1 hypothetical protein CBE89_13075 [Corynebacterium striatum]
MTHRISKSSKARAVMATPWWIRLAIYVAVGLVGLVLTILGIVEPSQVDSWLGQAGGIAAFIGGMLAAVHTGRASDEPAAEDTQSADAPAEPVEPPFSAYH